MCLKIIPCVKTQSSFEQCVLLKRVMSNNNISVLSYTTGAMCPVCTDLVNVFSTGLPDVSF